MSVPRVVLQPRRAKPFYARHPWVFPGGISTIEGDPGDGAEVDLVSHTGNFIARGLYNSRSKIRVRLYSWEPGRALDEAFFRERLESALRLRQALGLSDPQGAARLVFSEGDYLSGLTVDRYGAWLVVQITALGLGQRRDLIARLLADLLQPRGIYLRTERGVGRLEGLEAQDGPLWGEPPEGKIVIHEHGLQFQVDIAQGQKTGYYLDQRDNRLAVAALASGRRVLDAFCYSGGFGLHAARAGARHVVALDSSESALELARANAALNGIEAISFVRDEVFVQLESLRSAGERFGMVILDPPKFARTAGAVEEALRGYRRLHTLGLQLLEPGGILVLCCCSGLISGEQLVEQLAQVAVEEKRDIQLLEIRGQAPDHPVAVSCPESDYLKCLIAHVRD